MIYYKLSVFRRRIKGPIKLLVIPIYIWLNQLERKKMGQNSFIVSSRPGRKPQKAFCVHINCGGKKILTTAFLKNISSSTKSNTACFLQEIVFKKVWNTKKDDKTSPFKQLSHFQRRAALPGVWRWSFWLRQMIVYVIFETYEYDYVDIIYSC